jgi:hypothetical protein
MQPWYQPMLFPARTQQADRQFMTASYDVRHSGVLIACPVATLQPVVLPFCLHMGEMRNAYKHFLLEATSHNEATMITYIRIDRKTI